MSDEEPTEAELDKKQLAYLTHIARVQRLHGWMAQALENEKKIALLKRKIEARDNPAHVPGEQDF